MTQKELYQHYLKLTVVTLMWGGTFVAARFIVREVPPFTAAFLRFAIAAAVLVVVMRATEKPSVKIGLNQWLLLASLGLTGIFIYNALFFTGLKYTTAGNGSLVIATNPVLTAIVAAIILHEKVTYRQLVGILVSFSGVALVVSRGVPAALLSHDFNWGDLIMMGAPLAWAFYSVLGKKAMAVFSPLAATTYACLLGSVFLFPFALHDGFNWLTISAATWGALAFMAILASVISFNWWYAGINALGAGRAAIFINLVPLWAMLLGWIILNEGITPVQLLGAALIISGVYLTSRKNGPGTENHNKPAQNC